MTFGRIFLWVAALMSLVGGVAYLGWPTSLAAQAGFGELLPGGTTDVRATYGGLQLGMGLFLAWTALEPARIRTGLMLTFLAFGALATCRAIGVVLDGSLNDFHRAGLVFEVALTAVALTAVIRTSSPTAAA